MAKQTVFISHVSTETELAQFLKNAERWQAMSREDRKVWRSLVIRKAVPMPPLPPGLTNPGAAVKRAEIHFATNN